MHVRFIPLIDRRRAGVATLPVAAHHGWAGNGEEEFELVGTVESGVSLAGPHATMKVRAEGQVWDITLAPGARTANAGPQGRRHPGRRAGHHPRAPQQGPEEVRDQDRASDVERQDVQRLPRSQVAQRPPVRTQRQHTTWPICWRGSRVPPLATPCATPASGPTASST